MEKSIWCLILDTNIKAENSLETQPNIKVYTYTDFELAKSQMLDLITAFACCENDLFDGKFGIVNFEEYARKNCISRFDDPISLYRFAEDLRSSIFRRFERKPKELHWCGGNFGKFEINVGYNQLNMYEVSVSDDEYKSKRSPYISINTFCMTNQYADYNFCIRQCKEITDPKNNFGIYKYLNIHLYYQFIDEKINFENLN